MATQKKLVKPLIWRRVLTGLSLIFILGFVMLNFKIADQANTLSHFQSDINSPLKSNLDSNNFYSHFKFGNKLPKPQDSIVDLDFIEVDTIKGDINLEVWRFDMEPSKGVVALFHGYNSTKTSLWKEAQAFYRMGYTVVLVDLRASGNSNGLQSTFGFYEALDVQRTFGYCREQFPNQKVFLYGFSAGAVAIARAISEFKILPEGVILQSPYVRFSTIAKYNGTIWGVPRFITTPLFTFWMGQLNSFNAFAHNPIQYAKSIKCPTLLIHGTKDPFISYSESQEMYESLPAQSELGVFSKSGHESILKNEEPNWIYLVTNFMESNRH